MEAIHFFFETSSQSALNLCAEAKEYAKRSTIASVIIPALVLMPPFSLQIQEPESGSDHLRIAITPLSPLRNRAIPDHIHIDLFDHVPLCIYYNRIK
jgi:hypothetical protein